MDKGQEKLNASKPVSCDKCGGRMVYSGSGEYECERCKNIMLDDYGKVRRYVDKNGTSSILVLERETGVSKDVLEYLVKDGVLTEPEEKSTGKKCGKCGRPIESGSKEKTLLRKIRVQECI